MSALQSFARMLGIAQHQAEDALHSERAARAVLSRRSFFAAGSALASGLVMVELQPVDPMLELIRMIDRYKQEMEDFLRRLQHLNQIFDYVPPSSDALAELARGIASAEKEPSVYMGSFAHYADDDPAADCYRLHHPQMNATTIAATTMGHSADKATSIAKAMMQNTPRSTFVSCWYSCFTSHRNVSR